MALSNSKIIYTVICLGLCTTIKCQRTTTANYNQVSSHIKMACINDLTRQCTSTSRIQQDCLNRVSNLEKRINETASKLILEVKKVTEAVNTNTEAIQNVSSQLDKLTLQFDGLQAASKSIGTVDIH